ncbi:MAG: L-lactate dehydrogenase [Christensenellales bacterium]|jgi:L-lactate dehydrogenase
MPNTGKKISVIGAGNVGATITNDLTLLGLAAEIVVVDTAEEKAKGEAMDIYHAVPLCKPVRVYSGGYADISGSDIVVITAGSNRKPGQTRLDLGKVNVAIMKSIMAEVEKYAADAVIVMVSNPVDVLTYAAAKWTSIPSDKIISSGTLLDTIRLMTLIGDEAGAQSANVDTYVLGEHGETSFVTWSSTTVNGLSVEKLIDKNKFDDIAAAMRSAGAEVIKRKGATFYGVALSVCRICEAVLRNEKVLLPVGSLMQGEYGISDVCLSVPSIVGAGGVEKRIEIELDADEKDKLLKSANALKAFIAEMGI